MFDEDTTLLDNIIKEHSISCSHICHSQHPIFGAWVYFIASIFTGATLLDRPDFWGHPCEKPPTHVALEQDEH